MKHPMQAIKYDEHRTARFVGNSIVKFLLDNGSYDMNALCRIFGNQEEYREDEEQFAQLIGYSVDGFCDLSYVDGETQARADAKVAELTTPTEDVVTAARSAAFELERLRDVHGERYKDLLGSVNEPVLDTLVAALKELDNDQ